MKFFWNSKSVFRKIVLVKCFSVETAFKMSLKLVVSTTQHQIKLFRPSSAIICRLMVRTYSLTNNGQVCGLIGQKSLWPIFIMCWIILEFIFPNNLAPSKQPETHCRKFTKTTKQMRVSVQTTHTHKRGFIVQQFTYIYRYIYIYIISVAYYKGNGVMWVGGGWNFCPRFRSDRSSPQTLFSRPRWSNARSAVPETSPDFRNRRRRTPFLWRQKREQSSPVVVGPRAVAVDRARTTGRIHAARTPNGRTLANNRAQHYFHPLLGYSTTKLSPLPSPHLAHCEKLSPRKKKKTTK